MKDMKLFAGSIFASRKSSGNFETVHAPCYGMALSEDEAVGKMFKYARDRWPSADGWYNHSASALEVGKEKGES